MVLGNWVAANWHHLSYGLIGFIFIVNLVRGRGMNIFTSRAPFTPAIHVQIIISSLKTDTKLGEVWVADSDTRADVKITRLLWSDLLCNNRASYLVST